MGKVFISYSRNDLEIVDQFVSSLTQAGIDIWLDREDIKVGNSWRKEIVDAIDECDAFVFMMSSNSVASKNVHKEIILSQDSNKPIYVVMLEVVRLPAEIRYQLAGLQFINFPLLGFEKSTEQLITALKPHQKKTKPDESKQSELVIQGIDISAFTAEKQAELLAFISNLTNTNSSQLKIANITAGSVHVFINMPANTALQLKTFALNQDNRFAQLHITFFRNVGDIHYINIVLGTLVKNINQRPGSNINSVFGSFLGKYMIPLIITAIGIGFILTTFPVAQTDSTPPPASTLRITDTAQPITTTLTVPATPSETSLPTVTAQPTNTVLPTSTPEPVYEVLNATVSEHLSCVHGPGQYFLYRYGFIEGIKLKVYGIDINTGWGYVEADGYEGKCWVNLNQIKLTGDVSSLKVLYPGEVSLPLSFLWPPPKNVYSARTADGKKLAIYWDEYILPDGEIESPNSARYLLELWTCKNATLTFESKFVWDDDIVIEDEAGCSEPSHGFIYLVEKHGYAGPVEIPWTVP